MIRDTTSRSHVFGPVPSRRLGRSLGVDLVPYKTCTFDCIYCQLGRTTTRTAQRREWVPLDEVLAQVKDKLSTRPDYITLSGSGEPTLYSRLGELIAGIRSMSEVPVAVLTNGSLLWQPEVRRQLRDASRVVPSLDAGEASMFRMVNRPDPELSFDRLVEGLIDFRREFHGAYWLEVFLLGGYSAVPADARKIAACAARIRPDRVQLNTVTRPPAESYAMAVEPDRLAELAQVFEPPAEVIADYRNVHAQSEFQAGAEQVLALLQRRPCTVGDIAEGLGLHRNAVVKYLEELGRRERVQSRTASDRLYYSATPS